MRDLKLYIQESILDSEDDLDSKDIRVQPETKKELRDIIIDALKRGETDLNFIDTSKITNMSNLFHDIDFIVPVEKIDISKWDVSNVTEAESMFDDCTAFNSDLSKWDVSKMTNTFGMFWRCYNFTSDLSKWNVGNVTDMGCMFRSCDVFNSDLSQWDVSNVKNMSLMFNNCLKFYSNLNKWNISNVNNTTGMTDIFKNTKLEKENKLPSWYKE